MKLLGKLFFRGLAAILPLALTGYLVYAAVVAGESLLRNVIEWGVEELGLDWHYRAGMGFAVSIALVLLVGLLMYSLLVHTIYNHFTALLTRIPFIKSIYGMIGSLGSGQVSQALLSMVGRPRTASRSSRFANADSRSPVSHP